MTGTSPPAESPFELARRLLGYGVQEAVAMARADGIEEGYIRAAAVDVAALLMKFSESAKAGPPAPPFKVVHAREYQLRFRFRDSA